jgi:hypothetical protein
VHQSGERRDQARRFDAPYGFDCAMSVGCGHDSIRA